MTVPCIAYTPGEPAGIGPDLAIALAHEARSVALVAVADPALLQQRAAYLGLPLTLPQWHPSQTPAPAQAGELWVAPATLHPAACAGQLHPRNAQYVLPTIYLPIEGCLK